MLHLAQAYASAAAADQAYAVTAKALGSCTVAGDYLASGRVVEGAGDEATGSLIKSVAGSNVTGHTVLVSRTGRVLDVVDATAATQSPNVNDVAQSAGVGRERPVRGRRWRLRQDGEGERRATSPRR